MRNLFNDERGEGGSVAMVMVGGVLAFLLLLGYMSGGAAVGTVSTQPAPNLFSVQQDRAWQSQQQVVATPVPPPAPVTWQVQFPPAEASFQAYLREASVYGMDVITGDHAVQRHGRDAAAVRSHFESLVAREPIFGEQPPCKDGRSRWISKLPGGQYAVWVLEKVADGVLREVTAFTTFDLDYILKVREDCGNDGWWGSAYR